MKKILFLMVTFVLLLTSCLTTGDNGDSSQNNDEQSEWYYDAEKVDLEPNEIISIVDESNSSKIIEVSAFDKMVWLNSIMDRLNLHDRLSFENKLELSKSLFNVPSDFENGRVYRATAIGDFFGDGKNLVLYSSNYLPSEMAPEGSFIIPNFYGNFMLAKDKETGTVRPRIVSNMIMNGFNWDSF